MKQIALICIRSIHQEVRLFHAKSHDAVYLGLVKAALVSHPKVQYQLHCCKPPDDIRIWSGKTDFSIFYFLCTTQEIAKFFSVNFRNISQALYLLNASHYYNEREILHFQSIYRLPAHSVCAVSFNLAFQSAISQHKENQFYYLYNRKKFWNQNSEFLDQIQSIHLSATAYLNRTCL